MEKWELVEALKEMFKDGTIQLIKGRSAGYDTLEIEIGGECVQEIYLY